MGQRPVFYGRRQDVLRDRIRARRGHSVKVPDEEFDEMCGLPGVAPAHYVGRYKWITGAEPNRFSDEDRERMICRSYEVIVPKLPKGLRPASI